jgi:hypothetical protein
VTGSRIFKANDCLCVMSLFILLFYCHCRQVHGDEREDGRTNLGAAALHPAADHPAHPGGDSAQATGGHTG